MRAGDLIDAAERQLIESKYVDHWQKGRERIEAEELLDFVLGHVPEDDDQVPAAAARRYRNLVANPRVTVEVGAETYEARATILTGEERDRLYAKQAQRMPAFAEYQTKTTRKIPVVALERRKA